MKMARMHGVAGGEYILALAHLHYWP